MKKKRIITMIIVIISFGVLVISTMYKLMIKKQDYYTKLLNNKVNVIIKGNSAPRGRILDRNGNVLVDNVGVKEIVYTKIRGIKTEEEINIAYKLADNIDIVNRIKIKDLKKFWMLLNKEKAKKLIKDEEYELQKERKLSSQEIEDLKYERINEKMLNELNDRDRKAAYIYKLMNTGYSYQEKVIKNKDVTESEYALINELQIQGVRGDVTWERTYPYGDVFRAILGNVSSSSSGIPSELKNEFLNKGYELTDRVGISYLEKEYEEYLKGTKATYKVNKDNTLTLLTEAKKGNDLVLSIDINLQKEIEDILYEQIRAGQKLKNTEYYNHSYVIVGNPTTGEVLAMSGKQILNDGSSEKNLDLTTGIINSSYTMGSVVKGATLAVGYKNNVIDVGDSVVDSCVKLYLNPAKCSFKRLGRVNDVKALAMSSNYYQYLIAIKLTGQKYRYNMKLNANENHFKLYRNTLEEFGLGVKTQIDLPNEKIGIKGSKVSDDLLLNLAIGQYDTYTPIELFQYINSVATGKRIAPTLMKEIKNQNGKVIKSQNVKVLNNISLDEKYLERIRLGFQSVLKNGTGRGYTNVSYKPAGKTGTSESFYDANNDGVAEIETISSSYAMYAPYDNPSVSLVVVSPNVSHKNGKSEYMAFINRNISKEVSQKLFEN